METKILEVRDSATFIPVLATSLCPQDMVEGYYLDRLGFARDNDFILLSRIDSEACHYDRFQWDNNRTMFNAHKYIQENWSMLKTGDVVDVQYILSETPTAKVSERFG